MTGEQQSSPFYMVPNNSSEPVTDNLTKGNFLEPIKKRN